MTSTAAHRLLAGAIDYAGLFPPAGLSMADTIANYVSYLRGPFAWALGRLVVPSERLDEFGSAAEAAATHTGDVVFPLAILVPVDRADGFARLERMKKRPHSGTWRVRAECFETRVTTVDELRTAISSGPAGIEQYLEVPLSSAPDALLDAIAEAGAGAKMRTGGTTPDAIPDARLVARFIAKCASRRLPFKATAGLHRAIRGVRPLTYEPGAPVALMHGFLNVFVAAALLLAHRADSASATEILDERDPHAFAFTAEHVRWRQETLTADDLQRSRGFARSFGSCSFLEPLEDLRAVCADQGIEVRG